MCRNGNWIFQKPLWKMEGWDYNMKLLWWSASSLPFLRREKLKIKRAWQINHPVSLTQPPSLSEVSKYFVHNLFICHFSMNYADSEHFRTNRGFHDILCTCMLPFHPTFLHLFARNAFYFTGLFWSLLTNTPVKCNSQSCDITAVTTRWCLPFAMFWWWCTRVESWAH